MGRGPAAGDRVGVCAACACVCAGREGGGTLRAHTEATSRQPWKPGPGGARAALSGAGPAACGAPAARPPAFLPRQLSASMKDAAQPCEGALSAPGSRPDVASLPSASSLCGPGCNGVLGEGVTDGARRRGPQAVDDWPPAPGPLQVLVSATHHLPLSTAVHAFSEEVMFCLPRLSSASVCQKLP